MTKNPVLNAFLAALYIVFIVTLMTFITKVPGQGDTDNGGMVIGITMLSLFVLSAAVMGFIFGYQPVQLYLDGHKKEAVNLFLGTVGTFAVITLLFVTTLFYLART